MSEESFKLVIVDSITANLRVRVRVVPELSRFCAPLLLLLSQQTILR